MGKIKRSQLAIFLETGGQWSLIGEGVTEQTINYNPQTSEETYVHQDSGNTDIESYRVNIPTPMTAVKGDAVFDFVDDVRKNRKVLADAAAEVCIVYLYEPASGGGYPAERCACSIQIDDFGGTGGESAKINFTLNLNGDPVQGTFNPATKVFSTGGVTSQLVTFSVSGSGGQVAGAQIVVDGKVITTNANGIVSTELGTGTHSYTVTAAGYTAKIDTVTVSSSAVYETVALT